MEDCRVELMEALGLPLVNRFYKACHYSAKAGRGERVYVMRRGTDILAALRLVPKADGYFFLRSMCVHPNHRRQGLGQQLLDGILPVLDQDACYCYPFSHLLAFYGRIGFELRQPDAVSAEIREPFQRYLAQGRDIAIMVREPLRDADTGR